MYPTTKPETIRLSYSLPADVRSPLAAWQQDERTQYADDRAHMDRVNRAEMKGKTITRRPRVS